VLEFVVVHSSPIHVVYVEEIQAGHTTLVVGERPVGLQEILIIVYVRQTKFISMKIVYQILAIMLIVVRVLLAVVQ